MLEREGKYKLPEIAILWWDPQTKKMNQALLPAMEFKVEDNPDHNAEVFASSEEIENNLLVSQRERFWTGLRSLLHWVSALLGLVVFMVLGAFYP